LPLASTYGASLTAGTGAPTAGSELVAGDANWRSFDCNYIEIYEFF